MTLRLVPGSLTDTVSFYSMGYGTLVLKNFCDAVVVNGPVCAYETATPIDDFIHEGNLENTIIQAFPCHFKEDWTVESCNDSIKNGIMMRKPSWKN